MSINKPIQLGLCCLNTSLRKQKPPIFSSRRMILRTIREKGINVLKEKILQNLDDVVKMIEWNEEHGIKVFRLSSEIFPHKSNPRLHEPYTFDFALEKIKKIGETARKFNQRLTMHPGQYNCIGSPNENTFRNTILDLEYQATFLDLIGMGKDSVMVIHGGGLYGDKELAKKRWCENFHKLPDNVKKRIVLENCEKIFNIEDCLEISEILNIPVVFDTHHYNCYIQLHPNEHFRDPEFYIPLILNTWKRRGIKPKFHVSEQGSGRCGHHSDYIETIPNYLLEIPEKYNTDIDIMIEAKKKEQAIFKLYQKYPFLNCQKKREKKDFKIKINVKISKDKDDLLNKFISIDDDIDLLSKFISI